MKYCKNCEVHYDNPIEKCLICHNQLENENDTEIVNKFPPYIQKKHTRSIIVRLNLLLNILSILLSILINYSVESTLSWSLIVSVSNIYLILLVNLIVSKQNAALKVTYMVLLTTIEIIAIGFLLKDIHWAIDIILPFSMISTTLFLTIFTLSTKYRWQDYIFLLLLSVVGNILLILLNIFNVTVTKWAVYGSFIYGLVTLIGLIVFLPKSVKEELLRRFHT